MKHLKPYQIFESQELGHPEFPRTDREIHNICENHGIENYIINDDLSIDVNGDVMIHLKLKYLPLNFNYVSGDFVCSHSNLITLEGAPKTVGGSFRCSHNKLESLEYCPEKIGGKFICDNNKLNSLIGCPREINYEFDCSWNYIKTLKGCPELVKGNFKCSGCKLESLEYGPNEIDGFLYCAYNNIKTLEHLPKGLDYFTFYRDFVYNPIHRIIYIFIERDSNNVKDLTQEFNSYSIIQGNKLILGILEAFVSDFDLVMPDMEEVKKFYEIV